MSSLSSKDRVSLCTFTFSDGRRCRTPRAAKNPRLCFYHAQKEARAEAAETLGKDLDYFFSGDYLSACDLSTALGRLIPAVLRGDVKPRAARTVAYLAQTLLQAIHISQHEYSYAFGDDGWCTAIRNSVNHNLDYRFPPAPKPAQPKSPQPQPPPGPPSTPPQPVAPASTVCHPERSEGSHPIPATQRAPSPNTSLPPTSAEFVQHVVAGLKTRGGQAPQPAQTPPSQPVENPANCHPERNEGSASPSSSPFVTRPSPLPQVQQSEIPTLSGPASAQPSTPLYPSSATQPAPPSTSAPQPDNPPATAPPTPPTGPNRDAPWLRFDDTHRIPPDSHLL